MASPLAVTIQSSAAQTLSGNGASIDIATYRGAAKLVLDVSATAGTGSPLLKVFVQTSPSGSTWKDVGQFTNVSAAGFERMAFAGLERYIRARWEITGTLPSFTFALSGDAHLVFAQMDDISAISLPAEALSGVTDNLKAKALIAATDVIVPYLTKGGDWPKTTWGDEIRRAASIIAAYDLMVGRGFDPDRYDENFRKRYEDIIKWLEGVAAGSLEPTDPDPDPDPDPGVPIAGEGYVVTEMKRGW